MSHCITHVTWFCLLCSLLAGACENDTREDEETNGSDDQTTDTPEVPAGSDADTDSDSTSEPVDSDSELPAGIYPVSGLSADLPDDDLAPLDGIVAQAQVVALGESLHTSGGYYMAKHRLFRYLVEHHGFRAFGIESSWEYADLVGDYVRTCSGDVNKVVASGLFGVWASTEVADMVRWMCEHNQEHPDDPLSFFGFDVQQPEKDGPALLSFLEQAAPGVLAEARAGIERCDGVVEFAAEMIIAEEDYTACMDALDAVEAAFSEQQNEIVSASSAEELEWARIRAIGLRSWEDEIWYFYTDVSKSYEARDEQMAHLLRKMLELRYPGKKVVIWAHNWHIARNATSIENNTLGNQDARSMGTFLAEALGDDYLPIALASWEVSLNWPPNPSPWPVPEGDEVVEVLLHELGRDYLLVDLSFPGATEPFLVPGKEYVFNHEYRTSMIPADQYRAIFYIDKSPAMHPLAW
ncbi:MAG: erythromycin esterase family protein [Myxococcota bacterium]|nr:erythromycin esterase family protein [Myxococcota bacterium]